MKQSDDQNSYDFENGYDTILTGYGCSSHTLDWRDRANGSSNTFTLRWLRCRYSGPQLFPTIVGSVVRPWGAR